MHRDVSFRQSPLRGFFVTPCLRILFFALMALLSGSAFAQLPAGWSDADIGSPGLAGSASYSGGTWAVTGSGSHLHRIYEKLHVRSRGEAVAKFSSFPPRLPVSSTRAPR